MMATAKSAFSLSPWVSCLAVACLWCNTADGSAIADDLNNARLNFHFVDEPDGHPVSVRHEVVKRGDHQYELHAAEYVIVGSFKLEANARRFSKGLQSLDFKTQLGYLTATELWYVYIVKTSELTRAQKEQQRISKLFLLRDAWLLTVEP